MLRSHGLTAAALSMALAIGAAGAAEPPTIVKRQTVAGKDVLVRGFAEFDASCNLVRVQTVAVVAPPQNGKVETRPGPVVVGTNWVGGVHCEGTKLQGVNVFYVPAPGYRGSDRFSLDIGYSRRTLRVEVDVEVR
jgi:hypothetical protein